jgi:hypothetical protein
MLQYRTSASPIGGNGTFTMMDESILPDHAPCPAAPP